MRTSTQIVSLTRASLQIFWRCSNKTRNSRCILLNRIWMSHRSIRPTSILVLKLITRTQGRLTRWRVRARGQIQTIKQWLKTTFTLSITRLSNSTPRRRSNTLSLAKTRNIQRCSRAASKSKTDRTSILATATIKIGSRMNFLGFQLVGSRKSRLNRAKSLSRAKQVTSHLQNGFGNTKRRFLRI